MKENELSDIPPDRVVKRSRDNFPTNGSAWRRKLYLIIFESDTPLGLLFDVCLLIAIIVSVGAVCLSTVESLNPYQTLFHRIELVTGLLFAAEYILRIACVNSPRKYIFSFFGVVDLLAVLPLFAWRISDAKGPSFAVIRSLRLLRAFRVLGLSALNTEADDLSGAIWRSRSKITVFLATVLIIVTIAGSLMYEIEHGASIRVNESNHALIDGVENSANEDLSAEHNAEVIESQFTNIPQSMYWAIITMTTVGYGDVVPITTAGKIVSAVLILLGYSLIIVPTGFVSAEIVKSKRRAPVRKCGTCKSDDHDDDARYCKLCGEQL